jgi:DNA replication protein DnaC
MLDQGGGLVHAANEAEAWAKRFFYNERKGSMLILSGDSGSGKSMMARRLCAWVDHVSGHCRGASTLWVDWVDWWERYQAGRIYRDPMDMIETDCLFIDDIGAESDRYKSGQNTSILCQVLGKREKKYTVLTTNIPRHNFQPHFDTRVADRLKRNGAVYVSFWGIKSFNG